MNSEKVTQQQQEAYLTMLLNRLLRGVNSELERGNELLEKRAELLKRCTALQSEMREEAMWE
jgi:hypothetical protein